jgi:Bacterial regulatory proteins, luxR family
MYGLSAREREIATLIAAGLSTKALANRLYLSPWTVQDHLKSIFEKTGTHSRRALPGIALMPDARTRNGKWNPLVEQRSVKPTGFLMIRSLLQLRCRRWMVW